MSVSAIWPKYQYFLKNIRCSFHILYCPGLDYPHIKDWKGVVYFHKVSDSENKPYWVDWETVWGGCGRVGVLLFLRDLCDASHLPQDGSRRLRAQGRIARQAAFIFLAPSHFLADPLSLHLLWGPSPDLTEAAIPSLPAACCFGEADPSDHLFHECFQIGGLRPLPQVILCLLKIDEET